MAVPHPSQPVPPVNVETVLFLVLGLLTVIRRMMGARFCRAYLVGEMRERMERFAPAPCAPTSQLSQAAAGACELLRQHCAGCGRCELGR